MNRIDRLYALVEELRTISPRYLKAKALAARFDVSVRTIERDIARLRRSGLPIDFRPGKGYQLDKALTLPPLNFTPDEAAVIAVALSRTGDDRFAAEARSALGKLAAAMSVGEDGRAGMSSVARVIDDALLHRRLLRIQYGDRKGAVTSRDVEPRIFLGGTGGLWYLVAWCRLRDDVRVFRLDRIAAAESIDDAGEEDGDGEEDGETVGGVA